MPTSLTLGTNNAIPTDYPVLNNTIVDANHGTPFPTSATFWNGTNWAVLFTNPAATVNKVTIDLGSSNDTLTINTAIIGDSSLPAGHNDQAKLRLGGGNDSLTINSYVERYRILGGGGNDTVIINEATPAATVNKVTIDLGTGNDTLTVNAAIIGDISLSASNINQAKLQLGGGNDSLTINSYVERYRILGGVGNDTIIINEATATTAVDVNNSIINLGAGADFLQIDADLLGVKIIAGTTNSEGVDTIIIRESGSGVNISDFSITSDEDILILGGTQFSGADYTGPTGTFNSTFFLSGTGASIDAVNAWLYNGNTLILI